MNTALRHIHVCCAIIERDGLVLAAQRGVDGSMPLKWEFPGGKVDPGEGLEDCLSRELMEEMGVEIAIGPRLAPVTHQYVDFVVTLYPYICSITSGEIVLHVHESIVWLPPAELSSLDWVAADTPILTQYLFSTPGNPEKIMQQTA